MERRQFFKSLQNMTLHESSLTAYEELDPQQNSLNQYTGMWDKRMVAHLLRRATYGFKFSDLQKLEKDGLSKTMDLLFTNNPITELPLNYDFNDDTEVPLGSTWVNAKFGTPGNVSNYRMRSIAAWRVGRTYSGELSIKEKMVTFWINHFGIADIQDARYLWRYINLLYNNYVGDFKKIIEEITIDPSMLRFLNGNVNTRRAPNENFAREVLELFTIGKGPVAGPGDYTNYTEKDIFEIAKALTGWRDYNYQNSTREGFGSIFNANDHDTTTKTLSNRFGNAVINSRGDQEYKDVINIIFQQSEVSRFIARKLYRYFVYYKINTEIEQNIIEPMAKMIRDDKYVLSRAIRTLLSSEHFYSSANLGVMIKNPQDFMAQSAVNLGLQLDSNYVNRYRYWWSTDGVQGRLEMRTFDLPSVAGWKAYYQEPTYYQGWINSVTLPTRTRVTDTFHSRTSVNFNGLNVRIDNLPLLSSLEKPQDINKVLEDLNVLLFPKPFTAKQIVFLKKIMVPPNGNDDDWNKLVSAWYQTPTTTNSTDLRNRMYDLLRTMSYMPEYQLS